MSNHLEKQLFAERLKTALANDRHPISPTYISTQFNHRYSGTAISVQSANNWLLGKAIPNQDKLSILAIWLNVSAQWLRFGDIDHSENSDFLNINNEYLDLLLKFKKLNPKQKEIIELLINEFID